MTAVTAHAVACFKALCAAERAVTRRRREAEAAAGRVPAAELDVFVRATERLRAENPEAA
jgi:hypothetical protein